MCNKTKQGTKSRNRRAVRTLKLVYNDSKPFPPTRAQSQRQFGSDLSRRGERKSPRRGPAIHSVWPLPEHRQTEVFVYLGKLAEDRRGKGFGWGRVLRIGGKMGSGEGYILGKMPAWDQWQGRASWNRSSLGWWRKGVSLWLGGGSTLLDQARRPETYYTRNMSRWCMFPVGRGVAFNYSSESFIDSTQLIANSLWGFCNDNRPLVCERLCVSSNATSRGMLRAKEAWAIKADRWSLREKKARVPFSCFVATGGSCVPTGAMA